MLKFSSFFSYRQASWEIYENSQHSKISRYMVCTMSQSAECYDERIHTPLSLLVTNLYYCEPFQITANKLEFWTSDQMQLDQLKLQVEEGRYPPRFQIAAGGDVTKNVLAKSCAG